MSNNQLTGQVRYRSNWRGKLILQVQYTHEYADMMDDTRVITLWRDAKVQDLGINNMMESFNAK